MTCGLYIGRIDRAEGLLAVTNFKPFCEGTDYGSCYEVLMYFFGGSCNTGFALKVQFSLHGPGPEDVGSSEVSKEPPWVSCTVCIDS